MDDTEVIVSGRESKVAESDVGREICVVSDQPLAVSVVAQT